MPTSFASRKVCKRADLRTQTEPLRMRLDGHKSNEAVDPFETDQTSDEDQLGRTAAGPDIRRKSIGPVLDLPTMGSPTLPPRLTEQRETILPRQRLACENSD